MKKIIYWLFMLPLFALLNGCDDTDTIIFDDELPQFEIKANAILLEVIMPKGSAADDEYYIVGDFNGGAEAAVGNLEWQLEKATGSESKWGIYLLPSTFKDGKTLADGFYFVSASKGEERSVKNEAVVHQLDVKVGTRTNVWVDRWEAYFNTEEEGHDGFVAFANVIISLLRNTIPNRIRIIVQLVVVAALVTIVSEVLKAFAYDVNKQLSVFVGLIITNCILMGRLEAFALGNGPWESFLDGIGNGLGYALILVIVGFFRELLGSGTLLGFQVIPQAFYDFGYVNNGLMILPPMALIVIAVIIWVHRSRNKELQEN